jgi:hypothetical protein
LKSLISNGMSCTAGAATGAGWRSTGATNVRLGLVEIDRQRQVGRLEVVARHHGGRRRTDQRRVGVVLGDRLQRRRRGVLDRLGAAAVQRVRRVDLAAEFLGLHPILAVAVGQVTELAGLALEGAQVGALGVDLEQLGADGQAIRVGALGFLQDFFGLESRP